MTEPPIDLRLLNEFQREFPLVAEPWRAMAAKLGVSESTVLARLRVLVDAGKVGRIGAVFTPGRIGASTLAALAAEPDALPTIAARVSAHAGVNHNYEREHRWNLWFVASAPDEVRLASTLARIEAETGCRVIGLPLEEEYHIDLGFDLTGGGKRAARAPRRPGEGRNALAAWAPALIEALECGLELRSRPFERLGARAGLAESQAIATVADWLADGLIRRFGVIVRHHELGYTANAMSVWNVPDEAVKDLGQKLAKEPDVTLCYRRRRAEPAWPYNLYCMIHGRARGEVEQRIAEINARHGLNACPHALLFSRRRFKQTGARYFASEGAKCG